MRGPHNIWRLVVTGATLERTGAMGVVLDAMDAPRPLRILARTLGWPFKWLGYKGDVNMPPAPRALTALGPAYIKFGQVLSTRPDVVGDELAVQMRVLQDKLPPFPIEVAKETVAQELGLPAEQVFSEFSEPVAAASIAQVHQAKIAGTDEIVAVKVLRPRIEKAFRKDIDAFYLAAKMIELLSPASRRLRPMEVITHFEGVVLGELDLRLESSAASEFAANTGDDAGFTLPAVKWDLSARRVMTLGWADGVPLGDNDAIDAAGHDRAVLAARVLELFFSLRCVMVFSMRTCIRATLRWLRMAILSLMISGSWVISMNIRAGFMPRFCLGLSAVITNVSQKCILRRDMCLQIAMLKNSPALCGRWVNPSSEWMRPIFRWGVC